MLMFRRVANSEYAVSKHQFFELINAIITYFLLFEVRQYEDVASSQLMSIDILHVDIVIDGDYEAKLMFSVAYPPVNY